MRIAANLFLLLFLADGVLSLLDELLCSLAGADSHLFVRQPLALAVVLLALILSILLGIDRRLPQLILLPPVLFSLWGGLGFWPLPVTVEYAGLPLLASTAQVLVAVIAFVLLYRHGGRLLLMPEILTGPWFRLSHTLKYAVVSLLLLPFLLGVFTLASVGAYLEQQTAGFLRLTPAGIYMAERSYRKGDHTIRLAGMIHLGREEYYRDMAASVHDGRTLVLVEGVSDRDHLLPNRFDYGSIGEALGLVSQQTLDFEGRQVNLDDFDKADAEEPEWEAPDILRADVDVNRFDPRTIEFLNVLASTLLRSEATGADLLSYNSWVGEHLTPEIMRILMRDILERRNEELVRVLRLTMDNYDTVVIPWGALHMPGIEAAVLDEGFLFETERRRLSLDFSKLRYASLLGRFLGVMSEEE